MSQWVWAPPVIAAIVGIVVWSVVWSNRVVEELATRPERQLQIAGVDPVSELKRATLIGIGPWRMHRLRDRLDRAPLAAERAHHDTREVT